MLKLRRPRPLRAVASGSCWSACGVSRPVWPVGVPALATLFAILFLTAGSAAAYTPESPEVRAMVDRAYKYLASDATHHEQGGHYLVALTFVKDGKGESHPVVAKAVQRAVAAARAGQFTDGTGALYSAGLLAIFLAEVDAQKYAPEINAVLQGMIKAQKPHGGFSYPTYPTGDTSQTQYVVLALWTARNHQMNIPMDAVERVANWLLKTQDPSGGWGYQGTESAGPGQRVGQSTQTQSLTAAGLGSVYVCAELLGFGPPPESAQSGYPPALKLLPKPGKEKQRVAKSNNVNQEVMRRSMSDGNRWFAQNLRVKAEAPWHYYFLYALERYMSFRELAEGREEKEPDWYNQGVEYFASQQQGDGSFGKVHNDGPHVDTAFAVLFLTRSTKKAIAKSVAGDGQLSGGKGFKGNMASARVKDGKIIAEPAKGTVDDLVSVLEDPRNPDVDALAEFPESWIHEVKPEKLVPHADRLRRLVLAEKYEVRMVAVRALGRMSDFENVPHLIYALTDPDLRVVRLANEALRATTRKFVGFQLPANPNDADRASLVQKWKDWYRSVNPTAVFLD